MSSSDGNQPEPTPEEWRIAQEIDLRYPTTDAYAHALARHRVRVQRKTVGRAEAAERRLDLFMQPTPDTDQGDLPFILMRRWIDDRAQEKQEHRRALSAAERRAQRAERVVEATRRACNELRLAGKWAEVVKATRDIRTALAEYDQEQGGGE